MIVASAGADRERGKKIVKQVNWTFNLSHEAVDLAFREECVSEDYSLSGQHASAHIKQEVTPGVGVVFMVYGGDLEAVLQQLQSHRRDGSGSSTSQAPPLLLQKPAPHPLQKIRHQLLPHRGLLTGQTCTFTAEPLQPVSWSKRADFMLQV